MTTVKKMLQYLFNKSKKCYDLVKIEESDRNMAKYNKNLENLAKDILVKNDMLKLPVDLISIANSNDIDVYYMTLPEGISGAIKYNQDNKRFQILVEKSEPDYRKRFTLAHELSHFFLEREKLSRNDRAHIDVLYRSEINENEKKMDYLAGALLMNEDILRKMYRLNPSVRELSKVFYVSESAITVRLMTIGEI